MEAIRSGNSHLRLAMLLHKVPIQSYTGLPHSQITADKPPLLVVSSDLNAIYALARDHKSIPQGNLLLDKLAGVDLEIVDVPFGPELDVVKQELAKKLVSEGLKPYVVAGPRSTALAAVAFAWCIAEIAQQQQQLGIDADWIYTSSVGGTQAGLILGTKALALRMKPFGSAPIRWENKHERLRTAANDAAAILGLDNTQVVDADIQNTDDYIGHAYGYLTPQCIEALKLVVKTEGIFLDPVYTAKAMACLIDHIQQGKLGRDDTVIFLHTGGTPALFAYQEELVADLT